MYLSKLDEVKKYIKENVVFELNIYLQEFEDAYNTCIDVGFSESSGTTFTLGCEESRNNAEERAKSLYENLTNSCDNVNVNLYISEPYIR